MFTDENSVTETAVMLDLDSNNDIVTFERSAKKANDYVFNVQIQGIKIYIAMRVHLKRIRRLILSKGNGYPYTRRLESRTNNEDDNDTY